MSDQFLSYDPNAGEKPEAQTPVDQGHWEDRGIGGKVWHPPAGAGSERTREDNSLLGMPPELAVVSGVGLARAVAGAGAGAAAKTVAAGQALAGQAAPYLKYEIYRHGLMTMGIPWYVADGIAAVAAGMPKRGAAAGEAAAGEAAAAEAAPTRVKAGSLTPEQITERLKNKVGSQIPPEPPVERAPFRVKERVPSAPVETPSAAPAPEAGHPAAEAQAAPRAKSPQQLLNEEALAKRRAAYQARQAAPTPESAPEAAPAETTQKPKLTGAQAKRYLDLRAMNKTDAQAREILEAESKLASGLPTDAEVRAAVNERNASGNWPGSGKPPAAEPPAATEPSPEIVTPGERSVTQLADEMNKMRAIKPASTSAEYGKWEREYKALAKEHKLALARAKGK